MREFLYRATGIQLPSKQPLKNTASHDLQYEIAKRQDLFDAMTVNTKIWGLKGEVLVYDVPTDIALRVHLMLSNKQRYANIASKFACPIKWYHIACIHEMEARQNFNCYLGNGQVLSKTTTIVPIGRGPFSSFESGAIDAIHLQKLDLVEDWSVGSFLYIAEGYNGYGYSDFHNINSPYIWSGSNQYRAGFYIADHVYSQTTVSQQIGIALILKKLIDMGEAS